MKMNNMSITILKIIVNEEKIDPERKTRQDCMSLASNLYQIFCIKSEVPYTIMNEMNITRWTRTIFFSRAKTFCACLLLNFFRKAKIDVMSRMTGRSLFTASKL